MYVWLLEREKKWLFIVCPALLVLATHHILINSDIFQFWVRDIIAWCDGTFNRVYWRRHFTISNPEERGFYFEGEWEEAGEGPGLEKEDEGKKCEQFWNDKPLNLFYHMKIATLSSIHFSITHSMLKIFGNSDAMIGFLTIKSNKIHTHPFNFDPITPFLVTSESFIYAFIFFIHM